MNRTAKRLLGVILTVVMTGLCMINMPAKKGGLNIIDDKYRTTYEVFVYSFYDSDGDGIGDLRGLLDKLDYINDGDDTTDTDLGCNEIWLMPIMPSPTYHKYDVKDYMDIDPQYGTMEDFDALISACNDRGVRVIIDLVLNHTSSQHPWFQAAKDYLTKKSGEKDSEAFLSEADKLECPYLDYYNFSSEQLEGYEPLQGTDYYYEARFWSEMPDLNLDSEAVRQEISGITDFWTDHGVSGFRLDACTYFYTGEDSKNISFLSWLNNTVKGKNEDAYIVGEAWSNIATYSSYYASGVDSFFNFEFSGSEGIIADTAKGSTGADKYVKALKNTEDKLHNINPDYIDAPFYTNHDMARAAGYYVGKGASDKLKLSAGLNLLMGGNAFIYYGEELGMKGSGRDENKRAPMYWSATDTTGMCKGPADMEKVDMKYPPLDEQKEDPYSVYNYYKKAIKLRNTFPVIARGVTVPVPDLSSKELGVFVREVTETRDEGFGPKKLLVVINTSPDEQTMDLDVKGLRSDDARGLANLEYTLDTGEAQTVVEGGKLHVAPFGIAVLGE